MGRRRVLPGHDRLRSGQVDRPALEQERIARDFRRRRRGWYAEYVVSENPCDHHAQHSQENPTRRRGINRTGPVVT